MGSPQPLIMKVVDSSKMSVHICQTQFCYISLKSLPLDPLLCCYILALELNEFVKWMWNTESGVLEMPIQKDKFLQQSLQ